MKKNILSILNLVMLTLCSVVFLASCSSDDDSGAQGSGLTGQWTLVKATVYVNGIMISDDEFPASGRVMVMTFGADGNFSSQWADESADIGTWTLSADGKKLTVAMDGDSETANVEELSSSTMVLSYEEMVEDMGETARYKSVMKYVRL